MIRRVITGPAPPPRSARRRLLAGSALCGASFILAFAAQAQTLPGIPLPAAITIATGGAQPVITAPTANSLDVALNANRTVINWAGFHVSAADAVTFHFGAASDIVLNKSPTAVQVDAGGHVTGLVGAAAGGNIWFYSPGGVVIAPGAVMSAGNFVFARGTAIVDATFVDAASPLSVLRGASDALIQIDALTAATGATISAAGDVVLTASSGNLTATTVLGAGTANVSATTGSVNVGEVTATTGAATVNAGGGITLGAFNAGTTAMATAQTDVSVTSASSGGATGDILLTSLTNASLGSGVAGRDIKVNAPTGASLGSGTAGRSVFVTTTTGPATVTGAVQAGDDIEITATLGSVTVTGAGLTSTGANPTADAHVLVQSTVGDASASAATTQGTGAAAGDVTVQGGVTATLGSGISSRDVKVLGPSATLGSGGAARDVFVTATTGLANVTGTVSAGDDIEVTAGTGAVAVTGSLTSTGANAIGDAHVLAQSTGAGVSVASAATQGTGAAAGDITASGFTTASLGSGHSSHDIKVLGPAASLGSGSAVGDVFVTATTGLASVTGTVSAGDDVEVTAGAGAVNVSGALTATGAGAIGDAHVLARSAGSSVTVNFAATHGSGAGAGDVTIQGATTARLTTGVSANNINVLGPSASLGAATAAREIFVTATTGVAAVTGAVQAGDDVEVTATTGSVNVSGSLTATGAGAVGDSHVLVQSVGGSAAVNIAVTQGTGAAAGDITIQGATSAALTSGNSSRDLKVLGPTANLGGGGAARDVFVTATTGDAIVTGPVSAADDIEVTATTGAVTVTGVGLKSTGTGAVGDAHVLAQSASGSVSVSSAMTFGTGAAAGDVTVQGATSASLGSGASTHDIKVIGPSASLGSGTATNDVLVTATTGVASVTGAVSAGNDIAVTATTGSAAVSGSLNATRDVQILSGGAIAAGGSTITAGRDAAISATAGDVNLGSVSAGDDIAVRALAGAVTGSGDLLAGQTLNPADPDASGAADALTGATMTGHDLDIKAQTVAVTGNVSAGRAPVGPEVLGAAQVASDVIVEATNPDPAPGVAALQLATGPGKAVTAHGDVSLRAENAAASSIQAGDVSAGRDVAVDSAAGNVSLNSALAGDDVVLRAPSGLISVTGNAESGRDSPGMTTADAPGAGDTLNAARPFRDFDSNPGTVFSVVGFDVNVAGQSVHIGGATIAGREPSTNAPTTAGPIDATTSDVRIETRLPLTPTTGLTPDIQLGSVIATRDMQIDSAGGIGAGALIAGRDVAVLGRGGATPSAPPGDHTGAGTTIASALAGDDALIFSIFGRSHILGSVTAGATVARLVPTNDRTIDGATEAADQLAIYLHYFDLDNASAPYVLPGAVIQISGEGVTVGGALTAHGVGADIRLLSSLDISVGGATHAGGIATFQTQGASAGSVTVGAVTAAGDVFLDGGGAGTGVRAGALTSTSGDVAVRGRDGSAVSLTSVAAADDVVIRAAGAVTITGAVSAGGGADSVGLGDALTASDGALTVQGHGYDLTGHNVDIVAGSLTAGALTATGAQADVRIQTSSGVISVGDLTASRDVLLDGAGAVTAGVLTAPRDVGVRSRGGAVTLRSASAGDDVVIRAAGRVLVTGTLDAGSGADSSATDQAGDLIFSGSSTTLGATTLDLAGQTVDVRSSNGSIRVMGAVTAATDARFQTEATTGGSVTVSDVTAGRDVLLDGGGAGPNGAVATGTLTATSGDVAVRARDGSAISLADVSAGDDVVLRSAGAVTVAGAVNAGGGTDGAGLGDALVGTDGAVTLEGHAYGLIGHNVDIVGGSVTTLGTLTGGFDVRVQSIGVLNLADLKAGRDVLVDGGSTVITGALTAGRDVGVRSTGVADSVTVTSASAGDDVVIRANGAINVTGALTAGTGADSAGTDQAGDLIFGAAKANLGADLDLVGGTVDLRSSAGSIVAGGLVTAATDARFQTQATTGGSVTVAAVTAGRDVLLDGGAAGVQATGLLKATNGDVAVRGRDGAAVRLAGVSAGDDVAVRTTGAVTISGAVSAGGGSDSTGLADTLLTTNGKVTLQGQTFDLTGHDVDIVGGSVTTAGTIAAGGAASDVRIQSIGVLHLAALTAGRDVLVDGGGTVLTGVLSAGRDVGVRSTGAGATVTVGGASAGDDVVIRAIGSIFVTGALNAGSGTDSTATDQAGDLMFGAAKSTLAGNLDLGGGTIDVRSSAGSITVTGPANAVTDARFQTQAMTGGAVTVAAVTAGRDVLLDGSGAIATGALTASDGDVAVRARDGAAIQLADVSAGDDVVLRSTGNVGSTGTISTTGHTSTIGLGDKLTDPSEGGVLTIGGMTFGLAASDIDVTGGAVNLTRTNATGSVRVAAGAAGSLRGGAAAGIDILIDTNGSLTVGDLSARGDIGLRARFGSLSVGNLTAGDDIVLRATQNITAGILTTNGVEHVGVGDQLFNADPTGLGGNFDLLGNTIDVKSTSGSITLGAAQSKGDVRLQTAGGAVTISGQVNAERDIFADGQSVTATGVLTAGRDVAIYGRVGGVSLGSATAGNDLVVRASGDVTATGDLKSGQGAAGSGAGARLIAAAGQPGLFAAAGNPDAGVGVLDLRGVSIKVSGSINVAGGGVLRLQSGSFTSFVDAAVAGDIAIDSTGDITGGALNAGRDIALRSTAGAISLASAAGSGDVVMRAAKDITVSGSLSGGASGNSSGPGALLVAASGPISLFGEAADAGVGVIDLSAVNIKVGGPTTGAGAAQLRFKSSGVITLGDAAAGGDISIDAAGDVSSGALNAGRDVAVRSSGGAILVRSASAGDDIVLRAPKDITVSGALTAGGGADSDGAGDALAASDATVLAGNLALAGATIDVRSKGAIAIAGTATAAGDARFQTVGAGAVSLAAVSAGGDLFADGAAVQASGTLSAARDVAVRSRTGAVNLASITAGDNIAIRASGDVTVTGTVSSGSGASAFGAADKLVSAAEGGEIMRLADPLAATPSIEGFALKAGDIDILSHGAISLRGDVTAGSAASLRLQAAGKISAAAITAGDSIFVRGGDFALGAAWSAKTVRFEITASGGLALGDGVTAPSGGVALSNSTIGLINAPTLQIFVGDTSGKLRGGDVSIGTLSIDTSKIKTSLELYSGAASQVLISGAFAPIGGGVGATAVRIGAPNADVGDWTPGAIRVIANSGGSIGFSNTNGGRTFSDVRAFGSVELNAVNDILIGYQDFVDKLAITDAAGVSAAVKTLIPTQTGAPHMLVTAGTLTLRANGKVAQQDVGGLLSTNPTGLYLLGGGASNTPILVLGRTSTSSVGAVQMPDYIELNGAITSGASIMTGGSASLSNVIAFEKSVPPSAFYRLNSCAILQPGSCTSSAVHSNISIAPDKLTGLVVQDRTAAAGTADPTVASATNEEVWKDSK